MVCASAPAEVASEDEAWAFSGQPPDAEGYPQVALAVVAAFQVPGETGIEVSLVVVSEEALYQAVPLRRDGHPVNEE